MSEEQNLQDLAAALDGTQMTDDDGVTQEEPTSTENSANLENQTTEPEPASEETPDVDSQSSPQDDQDDDTDQLAVDEAGKQYVPQSRFNKVYGQLKQAQRQLEQQTQGQMTQPPVQQDVQPQEPMDQTTAIEVELLKTKYPQFDPESGNYSPQLDQLGSQIYAANQGITRTEAARRAMNLAKDIAKQEVAIRESNRRVKVQQTEPPIAGRVINRQPTAANPDDMSLGELEDYMKENNMW